jgi:hypothetical protein
VHAGWAVVAIVTGSIGAPRVLARRTLSFVPSDDEAFKQPYHAAASLDPQRGRAAVARATESADALAEAAFRTLLASVAPARVGTCAVLASRAREAGDLETILRSHAKMHAAEGILFREVTARAAAACGLDVVAYVEDDALTLAASSAKTTPAAVERTLAGLRQTLGAPWGRDEKLATLAGLLALEGAAARPAPRARRRAG